MNKTTFGLTTTFMLMATTALSQTSKQDVIDQLTAQGFDKIQISNTLFGNLRFKASGPGIEREVVLDKNGTVVRDRTERDDEDDEFDNEEDEDDEDDEFDDEENDDEEGDEGDDGESDDGEDDGESDGESDGEGDDGETDGEGGDDGESDGEGGESDDD